MVNLQRPASVPVDAFLLAEDDVRLAQATREVTKACGGTGSMKENMWSRCEIRHMQFREDLKLGDARSITQWMTNGSS